MLERGAALRLPNTRAKGLRAHSDTDGSDTMQNLRDKLLKAGIVDQKQKRKAEHEQRQERHTHKGHDLTAKAEQQRQALYEAQLEEQRARSQKLAEQHKAEQEAKERDLRVRYIADHYQHHVRNGKFRWYFVGRDGKFYHWLVDQRAAEGLEMGHLAIVERPRAADDQAHALVQRQAADMIWGIDDAYVRFLNRNAQERPLRGWEVE